MNKNELLFYELVEYSDVFPSYSRMSFGFPLFVSDEQGP